MAGNRRRKQENSGMRKFLYVVVVLVLLGSMGYLFYYSRSQAKERQEYIQELESKEAATKSQVQFTKPESESKSESETESQAQSETQSETQIESESESSSEVQSESQTEAISESELQSETQSSSQSELKAESQTEASELGPHIMLLNGTGKSGVAAYWKRLLNAKGVTEIVMADYKGTVEDKTVIYVAEGGSSLEGVRELFPDADYLTGSLRDADADVDTNVRVAAGQKEYDSYDVWIVVGKDDALHD